MEDQHDDVRCSDRRRADSLSQRDHRHHRDVDPSAQNIQDRQYLIIDSWTWLISICQNRGRSTTSQYSLSIDANSKTFQWILGVFIYF